MSGRENSRINKTARREESSLTPLNFRADLVFLSAFRLAEIRMTFVCCGLLQRKFNQALESFDN